MSVRTRQRTAVRSTWWTQVVAISVGVLLARNVERLKFLPLLALALLIAFALLMVSRAALDVGRVRIVPGNGGHATGTPFTNSWLVAVCWVAIALVTNVKFTGGREADAVTSGASLQNLFELSVTAGCALVALHLLARSFSGAIPRSLPLIVALVAWFGFTAVWSLLPSLTLARSFQFATMTLLYIVTVREERVARGKVLWRTTQLFMPVLLALTLVGFASPWPGDRFRWFHTHPGLVSVFLAIGILLALGVMRQHHPRLGLCLVAPLSVALILTKARGTIAALLVAIVVAYLVRTRRPKPLHLVLFGFLGLGVILRAPDLYVWLQRDQSDEAFTTLSGRTTLWETMLSEDNILFGSGFGAGRLRVLDYNSLGTGHNLWVELISGAGIVAAVLGSLLLVALLVRACRGRYAFEAGIVTFLIVQGLTSEGWALPGLTTVMLFLTASHLDAREQAKA